MKNDSDRTPTVEVNGAVEDLQERARIRHELHDGERVESSVTILRPPAEVYAFWRNFANLPRFMKHLESVDAITPVRSHWRWRTLGGLIIEWDSEIIAEIQNRMISWQSLAGSDLNQAGSVWFKPAPPDAATEVHVLFRYKPSGGRLLGSVSPRLAELIGEDPEQILKEDLRYLRWLLEAGEVPTIEGQAHGSRGLMH